MLQWFLGNYSYQAALSHTEAGLVNVLSSSSSLFTLMLAACLPSGTSDRFTLTKFIAVVFSIAGVVLVSLSDLKVEQSIPVGAGWALAGSMCYAAYLVLLKRRVDHEDKMSIPMFFGNHQSREICKKKLFHFLIILKVSSGLSILLLCGHPSSSFMQQNWKYSIGLRSSNGYILPLTDLSAPFSQSSYGYGKSDYNL